MPLTTEVGIQVPLTKNRNNRKLKNIDVPVEGIFLPFLFLPDPYQVAFFLLFLWRLTVRCNFAEIFAKQAGRRKLRLFTCVNALLLVRPHLLHLASNWASFWERVKLCCGKQGNIKEHQFRVETFINQLPLANQAFVPKVTRYKPSPSCRVDFPVSLLLLFSAINSSNHVVFDKACSLALARTVASAEKSFLNSWSTCVSGKS